MATEQHSAGKARRNVKQQAMGAAVATKPPHPALSDSRELDPDPGIAGSEIATLPGAGELTELRRLPQDVGWLLMVGGVIGFVAPGILGLDMLALGAMIVWPGNARRIEGWLEDESKSPRLLRGSMRQVNRFLGSLESRYPSSPGKRKAG